MHPSAPKFPPPLFFEESEILVAIQCVAKRLFNLDNLYKIFGCFSSSLSKKEIQKNDLKLHQVGCCLLVNKYLLLLLVSILIKMFSGIKTCILTNNWANDTGTKFTSFPFLHLVHYFDEEFESCKLGVCKPDPSIYKFVCSKMNVNPSEVCHFFSH